MVILVIDRDPEGEGDGWGGDVAASIDEPHLPNVAPLPFATSLDVFPQYH